ncbi:MAG: SPASM domain-containing protein [Candidatus Anammoxibacter sp.]
MAYLEITTQIGCKVACSYCPQKSVVSNFLERSNEKKMSFDTFKTCVDKLPNDSEIFFSGFVEPFLNGECMRMLDYAVSINLKVNMFTTTVGIREEDFKVLKRVKFERFIVHLPDNRGLTTIKPDNHYFQTMDKLIETIPNIFFMFTCGHAIGDEIHHEVNKYFKKKNLYIYRHKMHSRCGLVDVDGTKLNRINGRLKECYRLKVNILLPNGDVVLCCMDFDQKYIIGNLLRDDHKSLYESDKYKKVLEGVVDNTSEILCRYCTTYAQRHNLFLRFYDTVRINLYNKVVANTLPYTQHLLRRLP